MWASKQYLLAEKAVLSLDLGGYVHIALQCVVWIFQLGRH